MVNFYKTPVQKSFISLLLIIAFVFSSFLSFAQTSEYFNTAGSGTWVAPCGVTNITVEAWGGGGSGGGATTNGQSYGGGGGAGGAFARKLNLAVTPGTTYNYSVGAGGQGNTGTGNNGGDTWFLNTSTILAKGGAKGNPNNGAGGVGSIVGSIGDIRYKGGDGYSGNPNLGAAGGGGAGNNGNGGNASSASFGIGGYAGGGDGAIHRTSNGDGYNGQYFGGGGGGARKGSGNADNAGGDGYRGYIKITYNAPPVYCNINFTTDVEPITSVVFAGINRQTSNTINGTPALQLFCDEGTVIKGQQYLITVKGNTGGNYINYITVFFDWNQDGDFTDANERYEVGEINNSNGNDSKSASTNILIPTGSSLGKTKMRIIKNYREWISTGWISGYYVFYAQNPCYNLSYGQAEEYYVNITTNCTAPTKALANGQEGTISNPVIVCSGSQINFTQQGGSGQGEWVWSKICNGSSENTNDNLNGAFSIIAGGPGVVTYYIRNTCSPTPAPCVSVTVEVRAPGSIALSSAAATQTQEVCYNTDIIPVQYMATGSPVSIALTSGSLPAGVSGSYNTSNKSFTISGTPNTGVTGTYNYTLTVSGNSPCSNTPATISGSIHVLAAPTLNYSSNTATYCTGGPITANVPTITGGPTAISYSVSPALPFGLNLNTTTGQITGTPTTAQSAANYTITVNTNCTSTTKVISIAVSTGNTAYAITPNITQNVCSNFTGTIIGLAGSDNGIFYQLLLNGNPVGSPVQGTGSAISFGNQLAAGTYTVQTLGCPTNMLGSTIINVTAVPTAQFIYSNTTYCKAGLSDAPIITGTPQTGTFSASPAGLVFANATTGEIDLNASAEQTYTITYTIAAAGGCNVYTFSQQVTIVNSPDFYNVTGGGSYCGTNGVAVGLSGSQSSVSYQLYHNGNPLGTTIQGTGTPLSFGNQTLAGTYTVFAKLGGCEQQMDYEAIVTINAAAPAITVTPSSANICQGEIVSLTVSGIPPTAATGSTTVNSGNLNQSINNDAQGKFSLLRITGVPYGATITSVSINFNIAHSYDDDLRINLKGPNGKVLNIADRIGGSGDNFTNTTVNSTSTTNINTGSAPFTGTFAPHAANNIPGAIAINNNSSNVNTFSGLYDGSAASANGDWILSVRDDFDRGSWWNPTPNDGTFNNWSITINYTTVSNTVAAVWTPAAGLYTNPGATTAYIAGSPAATVYAKPNGTQTYMATVSNAAGCSSSANAIINVNPAPVITMSADYCTKAAQNLVVITASSTVNINSWAWSNNAGTSVNTSRTSKIEVNSAGTYYVSATASGFPCVGRGEMSIAQELVINGDFEQGNVGITTGYNFISETIQNGLYPQKTYTVNSNPNFNHNNFWGVDHTTADGNGKYMLVNGAANTVVWKQTVNVIPNTTYYFSAYAVNLNSDANPANLQFKINGTVNGSPTGALPDKSLNNLPGPWIRFYGTWNSGTISGPIEIEIIDLTNQGSGNDFGIDDISFATLSSFFNLTSAVGTDLQSNLCVGVPITDIEYEAGGDGAAPQLTAGALPDGLQTFWNGRNLRIYGTPTQSGTFNYTYSIGLGGTCGAPRTKSGTITVKPASYAGNFASNIVSVCYEGGGNLAANLTGTIGGLTWYSSATGNPGSFSPAPAIFSNLTGNAYYVAIAQNSEYCLPSKSDTVLVGVKNLWTGKQNNDWNNNLNWSDNQVPSTLCDDVIIPQVSPKLSPIISANAPQIKNLKIFSNATLEIKNDANLLIAGSIIAPNSSITAHEGNIELNAPSNGIQNISGSWFKNRNLKRLIVSSDVRNSATAGDTLNILFGLSFGNATADLATGDNITLRSTASATASVGKIATGNMVTGEFNIERFINYFQKWNMLSAPIRSTQSLFSSWQEGGSFANVGYGTQITGAGPISGTGLDTTSVSGSVKYYNGLSGNYIMVSNTQTQMVNRAEGFYTFVRGNRNFGPGAAGSKTTLRSKGTIYDASHKPALSIPALPNSFISIGNPYASAVDLMKMAIPNDIETNFYFWDPTLWGSYGVGGYQTLAAVTGGKITPGSSLYDTTKLYPNMQSGQAIFARTLSTAPNPIVINFTEEMKADSSLLVSRGNQQEADEITMISTMIYSANGDLADGNRVVFSDDFSNVVDRYDAIKITNGGINLGLLRNSKKLIVEARQPINTTDTLYYNMSNLATGSFKLGFSVQNIPPGNEAYLIDKFLQTRTPVSLTDSSYYNFTTSSVAASKAADRFMLVFKAAAGPLPVTLTGITATRNTDRSIAVRWTVENEVNIEKYEVERSSDGRNFTGIISADATNSSVYTKNDLSPLAADNFYRIKAITVGGYTQYSAIVKVAPFQELAAINIFPNPVVDQRTQIKFVNQTKGTYEIKLYNQAGQLMQKENVHVSGNNFVKIFVLNNNFSGGVYQLSILHPDGTNTAQQLIIK